MMRLFLFALFSLNLIGQTLPGARLESAAFVGLGFTSAYQSPSELRIAVDAAGNRFTITSVFEVASMVMNQGTQYENRGYLRKIAPDDTILWETRFVKSRLAGLAVNGVGKVYVAGTSEPLSSSDPVGFVWQIDTAGKIVWTIPIEGRPAGLALDANGTILVTGTANKNFRGTPGSWQPMPGEAKCSDKYATVYFPCSDAFVVKISQLAQVLYATLLGGTQDETATDIAIGPDGSAYVIGETMSDDFPTTQGVVQPALGGVVRLGPLTYGDGFVARIDPTGRRLVYGTYLGGKLADRLNAVAVDTAGNAIVTGRTETEELKMPGSTGEAMIAKLDTVGRSWQTLRYGAPDRIEYGTGISVSPDGRIFISISGAGVAELGPETLKPLRLVSPKISGLTGIVAGANGAVDIIAPGQNGTTAIFAVPPGQPLYGGLYVARYNFNEDSRPSINAIVNAASYQQGRRFGGAPISIAPGEILTIFGEKLRAPVRVTVGGRALDLLYASETQINALVPADIPLGSAPIKIDTSDGAIGPYTAEIAAFVPALFTRPYDGPNPVSVHIAAAINQDGTINSWEHPAAPGPIVALFATGLGTLEQHLQAYGPGGPGGGMEILYAGDAPGLPGVQQVNVRIDPASPSGGPFPYTSLIRLAFDQPGNPEWTQDNVAIFVR